MLLCVACGLSCTAAPNTAETETTETVSSALTGPIQNDWEDGSTQGWFPFGSPTLTNVTEQANTGTHSLKITNRTATFMGPGTSLTSQLSAGVTYRVSVATRLVAGQAPAGLKVTVTRSFADGTSVFEPVVNSTQVTDQAWVTLSGNYSFASSTNSAGSALTGIILYVESDSATASYYIDTFSLVQASLTYDFEDGSPQGWFAFGSPTVANSTDVANTGTHSLKTTNRTASFMGPGVNLLGQLIKGATYQITVSARLVAGEPQSNLQPTFQRTPTGGSTSFDSVMTLSNVTDQAWVTGTALYSFNTDNSTLIFYVQTQSGNASYYIDSVSITQVAPPPGPPANTTGASATFESGTLEGWSSRTGVELVANSTADAHTGSQSLLTTNRTAAFRGPAFNVTNVMFNGSRYVVSLWAKLAPGQPDSQLRVSLQRNAGTITTFHTVVGNTNVTANAWVRLQATYDVALANSSLTLYVESNGGTASFYIDDFSITFVPPAVAERDIPSVYQTMAPFFPIVGAAVIPADIQGEPAFLLSKHFNSITSGNDMKWDATEPTEGNFVYTNADAQVRFATTNNMHVRGHTLVWHNQTPAWVFNDASGNPMTPTPENRALLISRMQRHITTVMQHFGDSVPIWDVVNEPVDPAQPDGYRRSPWFNIIGKEYIEIALQAARAASPTAKLYINDFDTTNPAHRDPLLAIVRDLKSRGIPLDGFGHQMHNNIEYPPVQTIVDSINLFATTGVEQSVTELDYSIYGFSGPNSIPFTSYTDIPASRHNSVGYSYRNFLQAVEQTGKIVSLTIWGTSDDKSWLTSSTKVDAPLLFDTSLKKKPTYWAFVDPLQLPGADLSTTLTAAPTTVPAGQAVAYTVTVTNNADQNQPSFAPTDDDLPAANVTMTMPIPAHTGFASLAVPAGWSCSTPSVGSSGAISCTIASLAVGASGQFGLTVTQNDCAQPNAATIVASATVTSTTADPNPAANNTASATIQVSNAPPVITANGALDTTVECATSYTDAGATASDACDGPVSVTSSSNVNEHTVGSYAVSYTAADSAGGQATPVSRTVQVVDTTAPAVTLAGANPMTVECATSFVDPGASASDTCVGPLPVAVSGTVNPNVVGSYALAYTATDPSNNTGLAGRTVVVADTAPPAIDVVDLTILAQGLTIVVEDGGLTIGGLHFPLNKSFQVTVAGHTITFDGRTLTVDGLPALTGGRTVVLLPPNHNYRTFTIADLVSSATDTCDTSLGLANAVITQVSSDEAVNAPGSGNTTNDVVIAADCRSAQLRVERAGSGNGRVYTIGLRVRDASANPTATSVRVLVPADSGLTAVDDGPAYTVASACP
jgi:endo-1,4-beta-xylanase